MTPETTEVKLADFLCFAVYSANLAFGKAYKQILEELGLTYTQYITIIALWEEDNQTVGSLGEKLFLESNTLTPILKKLEVMGYVLRQRDPHDERQVLVSLTKSGRALRAKGLYMNLVAQGVPQSAEGNRHASQQPHQVRARTEMNVCARD
jgi:DNA-binding MarR family transcriptional regulator